MAASYHLDDMYKIWKSTHTHNTPFTQVETVVWKIIVDTTYITQLRAYSVMVCFHHVTTIIIFDDKYKVVAFNDKYAQEFIIKEVLLL